MAKRVALRRLKAGEPIVRHRKAEMAGQGDQETQRAGWLSKTACAPTGSGQAAQLRARARPEGGCRMNVRATPYIDTVLAQHTNMVG